MASRADLQILTLVSPALAANSTRIRWVLKAARWPGGIADLFTNRIPETDPEHSVYLFARKAPLDELALLHVLLNRALWRGSWPALDLEPRESPVAVRGIAQALSSGGRMREFLLGPLASPPGHEKTETVVEAPQASLRGRITEFELPEDLLFDSSRRFIPLAISSDLLARDSFHSSDVFVHAGSVLHPPVSREDCPHFLRVLQLSLQKNLVITASHLISIALFEFRLERMRFRFEKVENRLHDLARRMTRLDFPVDPRLRNAAFRTERMRRFRRDFSRWFYQVDNKLYFRTDEVSESDGEDVFNYLWFADQASHIFYDLGYNRKDLDDFILRKRKRAAVPGAAQPGAPSMIEGG